MHHLLPFFKRYPLFFLFVFVAAVEFWKLGTAPLNSFDEARFGANSFEMSQNGDYLNLYYQGEPDAWMARPPLIAWLIIGGYKLFGYNEWGLRFSSGVFVLLFFYFAFKWFALYVSTTRSFIGCLILVSIKGVIGFHVGRTGDMDAALLALLTGFLYFFSQYIHFDQKKALPYAGGLLAIAFWFKTMACLIYLPGIFLYVAISQKNLLSILKDTYFWFSAFIFMTGVFSWILIVAFWGTRYVNTQYAGDNAIETMLVYDIWMRFTGSQFDGQSVSPNYYFFFTNLDSRYNVWNYFFYIGLGFFLLQKGKKNAPAVYEKWLTLCAWIILPVFVLLTLGMYKLDWYSAPLLPLFTVFVLHMMDATLQHFPSFKWLFAGLLCFTLARHIVYLEEQSGVKNETSFLNQHVGTLQRADTLWVIGEVPQSMYLQLLWTRKPVRIVSDITKFSAREGRIGLSSASPVEGKDKIHTLSEYGDKRSPSKVSLIQSTN